MHFHARLAFVALLSLTLAACVPSPLRPAVAPNRPGATFVPTVGREPAATKTRAVEPTAKPSTATVASQADRIVFEAKSNTGEDIFSMNPDGSNLRQLTLGPGLNLEPACSPDGTHIAFTAWRDNSRHLYVMNADGSQERQLADGLGNLAEPAWSPDGQRIAFNSEADKTFYAINADGSGQAARLPIAGANPGSPVWSPDGQRLAYSSYTGKSWDLHVASLDGSGDINLTHSVGFAHQPAWSPDGKQIAFWGNLDGGNTFEIYVMNADGSSVRRLTTTPDGRNGRNNYRPAWSPDGKQIAFYSDRDGNNRIWIMQADGSGQAPITDPKLGATNPCWLPAPPIIAPSPTPPCDLACRDAAASTLLALTPVMTVTQGPSLRAPQDAYNQRVQAPEMRQPPTPTEAPSAGESSAAVQAARLLLTNHGVTNPAGVSVINVRTATWPDACLGLPSGFACHAVQTPGYLVELEKEGGRYLVRTDQDGQRARLAASPIKPMTDAFLQWHYADDKACRDAQINPEEIHYGNCGEAMLSATLGESMGVDLKGKTPAQYLSQTFAPFVANTVQGSLVFTGTGSTVATPAEQRAIAEWAAARWFQADIYHVSAVTGQQMFWSEESDAVCGGLWIYQSGLVAAWDCPGQKVVGAGFLSAPKMRQFYDWLDSGQAWAISRTLPSATGKLGRANLDLAMNGQDRPRTSEGEEDLLQFAREVYMSLTGQASQASP